MKVLWKKALAALLFALVLVSGVFASDPISFVRLSDRGIMDGENISVTVNARGKRTVSYPVASRIGGVIFQAVAVPATNVKDMPVSIEYNVGMSDGQRLIVTIGDTTITAEVYDWQLIPTARFAATKYTACVTLLGYPKTDYEIELRNSNPRSFMFAEFHPDFIDSLVGMNLFFIDAMLVGRNINRMRDITNTLSGVIPGYNDIDIDENESESSAAHIRQLIPVSFGSYIYTDYGTKIRYEITDGKLVFIGFPSYLFLRSYSNTRTVIINRALNAQIRQDIQHLRAINPIIYRAAEQTAQWAAFFRMVKEQYPQVWEDFIEQINSVETDLQIETLRYWRRN